VLLTQRHSGAKDIKALHVLTGGPRIGNGAPGHEAENLVAGSRVALTILRHRPLHIIIKEGHELRIKRAIAKRTEHCVGCGEVDTEKGLGVSVQLFEGNAAPPQSQWGLWRAE
jgi:hypothetical protein